MSSDCKRTGLLKLSASYWLFQSVECNKAQTTRKRIGSDRHRAVSVIYSEREESITQEHFLGRERKHCCIKWDSFEGFQVFSFRHSTID